MNHVELVSVVIPCYNYGAFIADTIASLVAQDYRNWEAIVVDDGSTDDTQSRVAVLMQEDARVLYVYQQNQGVSVARNTGIAHARGEFVIFLDADDLLTSSKLRLHVEHFSRCPDLDMSYSKFRYFSDAERSEYYTNYKLDSRGESEKLVCGSGRDTFPVLIRKNPLPIPAIVFRRDILRRIGCFEPGMRALEDWDFILRGILRGAFIAPLVNSAAMALIRVHPSSATRTVSFSDYTDRIYGNVQVEIDRLRSLGRDDEADFYSRCFLERMDDVGRRQARKERKLRRVKMMDDIALIGFLSFSGLYPLFKEQPVEFLVAYFRSGGRAVSIFIRSLFQ